MLRASPLLALIPISDALPALPAQIIYSFIYIVKSLQQAKRALNIGDAAVSKLNKHTAPVLLERTVQ